MSASSLSAAKRRRAGVQHNIIKPESSTPPLQQSGPVKTTISSYLNELNKRLLLLENNIPDTTHNVLEVEVENDKGEKVTITLAEYMNTMDVKFELLYKEINDIKQNIQNVQDNLTTVSAVTNELSNKKSINNDNEEPEDGNY